jgi:hypothetical protein
MTIAARLRRASSLCFVSLASLLLALVAACGDGATPPGPGVDATVPPGDLGGDGAVPPADLGGDGAVPPADLGPRYGGAVRRCGWRRRA